MSANKDQISEKYTPLFEGVELSTEVKEKAVSILAEAEENQANQLLEQYAAKEKELETEFDKNLSEAYESMVEKVDGFLETVVESWLEKNEIAIETGIRVQIAENFINGMKDVFTESYIDVPEGKADLVDVLESKLEEQEETLDSTLSENYNLKAELNGLQCEKTFDSLSEGLALTDKEKFKKLVEDVDINDPEAFELKVTELKESFFGGTPAASNDGEVIAEEVKDDDKKPEVIKEEKENKEKSSLSSLIPTL